MASRQAARSEPVRQARVSPDITLRRKHRCVWRGPCCQGSGRTADMGRGRESHAWTWSIGPVAGGTGLRPETVGLMSRERV